MPRVLVWAVLLAVTALFFPSLSVATEVASIQVRGKSIKVGDTADYVFSVLKKDEMLKQDVRPDPKNPNSLALTKYYTADGKSFALSFARQRDPGPYMVTNILIDEPGVPSAANALSVVDFERSPFFQKHKLVSKDEWALKSGGKNYYYSLADPENSYSGIGVELSSDPANVKKISVSWHGKSTPEPATFTRPKEVFLRDLLGSTFSDIKPDALISYVGGQKGKNYPGGGNVIPRKRLDGVGVYCGTVGSTLIVGIER
jgi:hypothetical protein